MIQIREVVFLEEAAQDLHDACVHFNRIQPGVGDYCWDKLIEYIEAYYHFAGIHVKQYGYFRMLSNYFPYAIYYEIRVETARVIAVMPMKRDPKWIEKQLRNRR